MPRKKPTAAKVEQDELSLQEVTKRLDEVTRRLQKVEKKLKKLGQKHKEKKEPKQAGDGDAEQGGGPNKKRKMSLEPAGNPEALEPKQKKKQAKKVEPPVPGSPTMPELTDQQQSALALLTNSGRGAHARKKPSKPGNQTPGNRPVPATPGTTEKNGSDEMITDPKSTLRCYEALNVPRTAKPEMIKKAFRVRALLLHPDKPTGNHKMFQALHEAFELMQDPTQRAIYDSELVRAGSRDGLSYTESDTMQASPKVSTEPGVFAEVFLSYDDEKWPQLFSVLTNEHLVKLVRYLQKNYVPEEADDQHSIPLSAVAGKSTPGINRSGQNFFSRIFIEGNFTVETCKVPDLPAAIDGRIALLRLRTRVSQLKNQSECGLEDAMRLAVQELRSAEQHVAFWLHFSYKFQIGKTNRFLQTPFVQDLEVMLFDRQKVMDMVSAGNSAEELQQAQEDMKIRERLQRTDFRLKRDERLANMLTAAEHHANVRSALQADMLAIGHKPENDEKCEDNDEKGEVSDMEDEQTLSSLAQPKIAAAKKVAGKEVAGKAKAKPQAKKKAGDKDAKKEESSSSSSSSSSSDSDSSS